MRIFAFAFALAAFALALACTEVPGDLPPCVNPNGPPCPDVEAGADADASDAGPADAAAEVDEVSSAQ